jgi:hypothetical protein
MERVYGVNEIPELPVHPGCRCTLIIATEEVGQSGQKSVIGQTLPDLMDRPS